MAAGDVAVSLTQIRAFNCNVFDGVDDYVEIPHNAAQLGANLTNGFTISAWINPRSAGEGGATTSGIIMTKGSGSPNGFLLGMRQDNAKLIFYLTSANKQTSTNALTFGTWQHILITISGANPARCFMYINGVQTGTANYNLVNSVANIIDTNSLWIGNRFENDYTFDGSIRSVKMWNRVLTTTEIANDYAGLPNTTGLIHHFKLGGDYADYGSVGVTATNSGSIANTTLPLKLQTNAKQLNLAAVTDKIICVPRPGRIDQFALIGANRAAA